MSRPSPVDPSDEDFPEPPRLRNLRRMVTLLTVSASVAVLAVAGALVVRATRPAAPGFDASAVAAETLVLPAAETVTAAGAAPGAVILVTRDAAGAERLRFYDARTGAPGRVVALRRE